MKIYYPSTLVAAFLLIGFSAYSQLTSHLWTPTTELAMPLDMESAQIKAHKAAYYQVDIEAVQSELPGAPDETLIWLPDNEGDFTAYSIRKNSTFSEGLSAVFPDIETYTIIAENNRNRWGKLEISHKGIRAMVFSPGESTTFIDPVFQNNTAFYMVYKKSDFYTDKLANCLVESGDTKYKPSEAKSGEPYNDCELKTYRIAIAATGEYTTFHGGTTEDAAAAIATTMNRVNGVYERDFGVTMTVIENNDILIYEDAGSDPYTNGSPGNMIQENQQNVNSEIGAANYDIGHVFGTNSGGLAGLGVTCNDNAKARGVTGSAAPINDPFDIDYVAHEVGHQFAANHSFNNACNGNRNNSTAVEPGSGSTIMAYAGICDPNVQNNSDDHFHGVSMSEIGVQISNNNCQVNTPVDNSAPEIADLPEVIYIPVSTPFALAANATDADDDELTYCWEQMDIEISPQPPQAGSTAGPNFRSNSPTTDSVRYFPSLAALVGNGPFTWERIPSVPRNMSFRVSVRDNAPVAGCTQFANVDVVTVPDTEPFTVLYPSENGIVWNAFDYETVTWDVANTDAAPISAETVDIYLSTTNGFSFPTLLAEGVPNTGSHQIQVPNVETGIAKVMVMSSAGTFFDVSDNNFDIVAIENGFVFETDVLEEEVCQNEPELSLSFNLFEVGAFGETVDLVVAEQPENAEGTGVDFSNSITVSIDVIDANPVAAQPQTPEDEAEAVATNPTLGWEDNATVGMTYEVEISAVPDFSENTLSSGAIEENAFSFPGLLSETTYFWRVINSTSCGTSEPSEVFSFTTFTCLADLSTDTPVEISPDEPNTVQSEIEVLEAGLIADLNVLNIQGEHPQIGDLVFRLISPNGTDALLTEGNCGLNITLDSGGDVVVNSPATIAGEYASSGAAAFGPNIPGAGVNAQAVLVEDGEDEPNDLCSAAVNPSEIAGNIALVNRGECTFVQKVLFAQEAGAEAVIVINNVPGDGFFDMGGNSGAINIPSVMISYEDGQTLLSGIGGDGENFNFGFDDDAPTAEIACPATDGSVYIPSESLSVFDGENALGTWILEIEDISADNGGSLNNWELQVCFTSDDVSNTSSPGFADAIKMYPNPTSNTLQVDLGSESNVERIEVIDIQGRKIKVLQVTNALLTIDLSAQPNGMYFVQFWNSENQSAVLKAVKSW
ncbi:MAG: M12 family metallo-peptidase [Flavobacteriales bacterium]|nr:M12 family metallo-peptidase [Flavobacteriales bacterium]